MITLSAGGARFSAFHHDAILQQLRQSPGIYLRISRCNATEVVVALKETPHAVPLVVDDRCDPSRAEFRDAENGMLLGEITNLYK